MLSRAVGVEDDVEIDITMEPVRLESGDALVLCSDGLTNVVEDDEIQQLVTTKSAQTAVERLIQLAKERGAPDNVTVQIIKCNDSDIEEDDDTGATTIQTAPRESFPKLLIIAVAVVGLTALSFFLVWLFTIL
jgi:serine/threonine protein phosphatase PrpC